MKRLGFNVGTVVFNHLYFSIKCDNLFQSEKLNCIHPKLIILYWKCADAITDTKKLVNCYFCSGFEKLEKIILQVVSLIKRRNKGPWHVSNALYKFCPKLKNPLWNCADATKLKTSIKRPNSLSIYSYVVALKSWRTLFCRLLLLKKA